MDRIAARVGAGLVVLLLGAAACGGDDDDGAAGRGGAAEANPAGGDGSPSADVDPCSLLEQSDVEAQFGDRGAVTPEATGCDWQVGEFGRSGTGSVNVLDLRTFGPIEEDYGIARDVADHPVDVDGVGDEAFFDLADPLGNTEVTADDPSATLTFRTGDLLLAVQANFFDLEVDPDQERDRLIALAEKMLERL